jgi:hypothetical protein
MRFAHPHQASSPRTSVAQRLVTAVAVDDQNCLRIRTMQPCIQPITKEAKVQAALIQRFADNETKGEKSLQPFRVS